MRQSLETLEGCAVEARVALYFIGGDRNDRAHMPWTNTPNMEVEHGVAIVFDDMTDVLGHTLEPVDFNLGEVHRGFDVIRAESFVAGQRPSPAGAFGSTLAFLTIANYTSELRGLGLARSLLRPARCFLDGLSLARRRSRRVEKAPTQKGNHRLFLVGIWSAVARYPAKLFR